MILFIEQNKFHTTGNQLQAHGDPDKGGHIVEVQRHLAESYNKNEFPLPPTNGIKSQILQEYNTPPTSFITSFLHYSTKGNEQRTSTKGPNAINFQIRTTSVQPVVLHTSNLQHVGASQLPNTNEQIKHDKELEMSCLFPFLFSSQFLVCKILERWFQ